MKRPPDWKPSADVAVVPMPDGTHRRLCKRHWQGRIDAGEPLPRSSAAASAEDNCEDCAKEQEAS
jgi:hypothetical protein